MTITLTSKALEQINATIKANDLEGFVVRVSASATDAAGIEYELDIVEDVSDNDRTFETAGPKVVCDPQSYLWVKGTTVDFSEQAGGFSFVNPRHR
jgi:iron-sulfur cluster assembly protein